ncbi:hypothetical protein V8F33_013367 [Rhypophila sp. PSN 637]
MGIESQTPRKTATALCAASPAGDDGREDFESVLEAYVAKTNPDQITRIKDFMTSTLQSECKKQDDVIQSAWEAIEQAIRTFNANREKLVEIMKREEGVRRTEKAIEIGALDKIVPQTYKKIVDEIMAACDGANNPPSPASLGAPSPALLPANLPGASNDSISTPTSPTVVTRASPPATAPPATKFKAKRSRPEPPPPSVFIPAKRAKVDADLTPTSSSASSPLPPPPWSEIVTRNSGVPGYAVEGKEHIFSWPKGSSYFYVLRCDGEKTVPAHTFKVNPWLGRPSPAVEHYCNNKRCRGDHEGDKSYSPEEIVKRWGHRVTGPDVKEAWVSAANEKLEKSEARKDAVLSSAPTGPRNTRVSVGNPQDFNPFR